jgi:hypothetical protein
VRIVLRLLLPMLLMPRGDNMRRRCAIEGGVGVVAVGAVVHGFALFFLSDEISVTF